MVRQYCQGICARWAVGLEGSLMRAKRLEGYVEAYVEVAVIGKEAV